MVDDIVAIICFALDLCHSFINGRLHFPFALELYTLFFKRFHSTKPTLTRNLSPRPRTYAYAHVGSIIAQEGTIKVAM